MSDSPLSMSIVGKSVESVRVSLSRWYLWFVLSDGDHVFWQVEGDLAECWFEHVESYGFKGTVTGVDGDGVACNVTDVTAQYQNREDVVPYEAVENYSVTVFTDLGRLVIDMRSASNGYYSGRIVVAERILKNTKWRDVE